MHLYSTRVHYETSKPYMETQANTAEEAKELALQRFDGDGPPVLVEVWDEGDNHAKASFFPVGPHLCPADLTNIRTLLAFLMDPDLVDTEWIRRAEYLWDKCGALRQHIENK